MRKQYLNCDKEQGTIEITLSKREMVLADVLICVDYKRIELKKDNYEIKIYYGYTDTDLMELYKTFEIHSVYGELKERLVSIVEDWLSSPDTRSTLRCLLRNMRLKLNAIADYSWRIMKFYPTVNDIGYENMELSVEYTESIAEVYIKNKESESKNQIHIMTIDNFEENRIEAINNKLNALIKDKSIEKFISEHWAELELVSSVCD